MENKRKPDYRKTLVLDKNYIARSIISSERAFAISYKGNAEIVENHPQTFGLINPKINIFKPSIIRIFKDVKIDFHKVKITREGVFMRDNYECVYCGEDNKRVLTLDHVTPKSKGGKDTWTNLVTACKKCNNEKDNLTVLEWGREEPNPKRPHSLMLVKKLYYIPAEWQPYLFLK